MNLSKIKYLISGLLWMSIAFSSCDSNEEKEKNVLFGGRLGQYKYYDMDKVIRAALNMVKEEMN